MDGECTKFKVEVHFHHLALGAQPILPTVEAFTSVGNPIQVDTTGVSVFDYVQCASDALARRADVNVNEAFIRIRIHNHQFSETVLVDMPGLIMTNYNASDSLAERAAARAKSEQIKMLTTAAMKNNNNIVVIVHGEDRPDRNSRALELWGDCEAEHPNMPTMIAVATKVDRWHHQTSVYSLRDLLVFGNINKELGNLSFPFPRLEHGWFATCGRAIANNNAQPPNTDELQNWVSAGELKVITAMLDNPASATNEAVDDRIGTLAIKRFIETKLDEKLSQTWAPTLRNLVTQVVLQPLLQHVASLGGEPTPELLDFHVCLDAALQATSELNIDKLSLPPNCHWEATLERMTTAIVDKANALIDKAPRAKITMRDNIIFEGSTTKEVRRFERLSEHLKTRAHAVCAKLRNTLATNDVLTAIEQAVKVVAKSNDKLAREVFVNFLTLTVAPKLLSAINEDWQRTKSEAHHTLAHCCESEEVKVYRSNVNKHKLAFENLVDTLATVTRN
jgi:hypothetical protein